MKGNGRELLFVNGPFFFPPSSQKRTWKQTKGRKRKGAGELLRKQSKKMPITYDLLHPPRHLEKRKHKFQRLVPCPNSYFMDVKCPGCFAITTVFSHAQTVVTCQGCNTVLCQPTGGKARLTEGCGFRLKRG